ncbi:putative peptidase Lmo0363 [Bacteroidia bacterium]|nr:putative peptidase Lmo0363 [Bacteroidia bacterium]
MNTQRLFLASFFSSSSKLFADFAKEDIIGKTVTFIPTAAIPEKVKFYVASDKKALQKIGLIVDELEILTATNEEISDKLKKNDYIFISGGNTFFLLQELKRTGADKIIIEQISAGKIYIGSSAGSIILSPDIEYVKDLDDCSKAPELDNYLSLSVVDFYPLPHHTNFPFKKAVKKIISKYESTLKLIPISNSQAITVNGNKIEVI